MQKNRGSAIILTPPAVESLLYHNTDSLWPHDIQHSEELKKQAEIRVRLHHAFNTLFARVGSTQELMDAVDAGVVSEKDASMLYQSLANFLEAYPYHARIILYLPFELIPHRFWNPPYHALKEAIARFIDVYMKCWNTLLSVTDVRANFADGDVPEPDLESSPPERVVKAAHLIPMLIQKRLISLASAFDLIDDNPDSILAKSVIETLPVLGDGKLLPASWMEKMLDSRNITLPRRRIHPPITISPARAQWLKQKEKKELVETRAKDIAYKILHGCLPPIRVKEMGHKGTALLAIIRGITIAVETLARKNQNEAIRTYVEYAHVLLVLHRKNIPEINDALTSAWSHLCHLGIVDASYLKRLGILLPNFDALFAEHKAGIKPEIDACMAAVEHIWQSPEFSRLLYPVCILFGSRIKGYGTSTADLDIAIFVRPEISEKERPALRNILTKLFLHNNVGEKAVEFWLKEQNGMLEVRDFPNSDTMLLDSMCTHVLFGGAWCGDTHAICALYAKLLSGYLYSKNIMRGIWLEEMERDILQYRLMHKGYARFFPPEGGIHTEHADCIDGQSMFYDSGYRRLATTLFITKVFLPQLEKPIK